MTTELRPPERYRRIIEAVCEQDRLWFEQNHGLDAYVRRFVPGECWPQDAGECDVVVVTQLAPGVRVRNPCKASGR